MKSLKSRWFDAALIGAFALVTTAALAVEKDRRARIMANHTAALARLALDGTLSFAGCFGALLP